MKLFVDYREKHLAELLEGVCQEITFLQLPIGDYLIASRDDALLIERKTVNDFFSSVRSNRLWDQLLRMMKVEKVLGYTVKRRMCVVHGNFNDYLKMVDYGSQADLLKHWSQLMGAFFEVIYVYNTPIIHAESDEALKAFMRILVKRETAGKNDKLPDGKWYRKPAKADLPVKDRKRYILAALPYIGDTLAENLLQHFKMISEVACAPVEELQKVPKIGKKKAELIHSMFH